MNIDSRVQALRKIMKEQGVDAFIIPSSDNHISEYVSKYFKCREWITGFTGSAGTAVVTMDEAHLWVDGRYYIQAERQVEGSQFIVEKMGMQNVKKYSEWVCDALNKGQTIGFNGRVMPINIYKEIEELSSNKGINIKVLEDVFESLWVDRPQMPKEEVFVHDIKYSGKSILEKLNQVREEMKKMGVTHYVIAALEDIAWLLNLRGNDVQNTPVFLSYILVALDNCSVYIHEGKLNQEAKERLNEANVSVKEYSQISDDLSLIKKGDVVLLDPNRTTIWLKEAIDKNVKCVEKRNITTTLKAKKNSVELENTENSQIKDGVAMVKFIYWLKNNLGKIEITELSASAKLEELRRQQENCLGISFDTIAAVGPNAAMMHYKATEESYAKLERKGFFLLDSGGQYLDGTTDITRTFALGELTEEEKEDYTLVLKSHIALNRAVFLHGATGSNLDVIARMPMWRRGLDYKCGTGHGVGYLLSVHEGPQSFSQVPNDVKLEEGMIITNEPGIYKEGKHGIRIENTITVKPHIETEFGKFMRFEVISYCPIDLEPVKVEMLTDEEREWLNEYHRIVYSKLSKHLSADEDKFLKEVTNSI